MKKTALLILSFFVGITCWSQSAFVIENDKKSFKLLFEEVNNLVIIPVELNGVALSFLLDTGANTNLLFTLPGEETIGLNQSDKILLKGMGTEEPITGYKSEGNTIKIGKAINYDFSFYSVDDENQRLSNIMGVPIDGIIGNDLFKDFVLKFNFQRKLIKIYDPEYYKERKCRSCEDFEITFFNHKPYITLGVDFPNGASQDVNLLIDSGSSEAVWLFQDIDRGIELPENKFKDFLGLSLSGNIYGYRGRVKALNAGKFKLEDITASFPDTLYTKDLKTYKERDGSLGGRTLNRFDVIFNYPENKIRLKPNRRFNDPFNYDMSGVAVARQGFDFVVQNPIKMVADSDYFNTVDRTKYSLEPAYVISEIRSDSPAADAGLEVGDHIKTIHGKPAYKYSLQEIISLLSSEEGKRIKLRIERDGDIIPVNFILRRKL